MQFIIHVNTLIENKGRIALVKERMPGKWNLPGGHLELGERLIEGAQREIYEEIGQEIYINGFVGIYTGFAKDHLLNIVFTASTNDEKLLSPGKDVLEGRWFEFQDVLNMDNDLILNPLKLKQVIRDYQARGPLSIDYIREDLYAKKHD